MLVHIWFRDYDRRGDPRGGYRLLPVPLVLPVLPEKGETLLVQLPEGEGYSDAEGDELIVESRYFVTNELHPYVDLYCYIG